MAFRYDPEAGYLATACRVTNTVVPLVLRHGEFWVFLAMHLLVCFAFRNGYLQGADEHGNLLFLSWNDIKVITAATTILEVLYTNSCVKRYNTLYELSRNMFGIFYDFTFELRLHVRATSPSHLRLAARWLAASTVLFFCETKADVSDREWEELLKQGLLKLDEKEVLSKFHGHQRSLILLQWCAEVARDGCKKAQASANAHKSLVIRLEESLAVEQTVLDTIALPLPFQYFHLLNIMVVINLLLWLYGMGTSESIFAPMAFFLAALVFLGILELASTFSDPFGDDPVDFPVADWVNEFLENTAALLEFDYPHSLESRLASETPLSRGKRHLNLLMEEHSPTSPWQSPSSKEGHGSPHKSRFPSWDDDAEDADEGPA